MKFKLTLLLFTIVSHWACGQAKVLTADSDTAFWYRYYGSLSNELGVQVANEMNNDFFFRFWDGFKSTEVSVDDGHPSASVIFFLREFRKNKEGRLYSKKHQLSSKTANEIYSLIIKYDLQNIRTDKQIDGWSQGLDGITYIIEESDKTSYSFKNFWTPTAQKDVKESGQLLDFITELRRIEEINVLFNAFMDRQPFTSWYGGIQRGTIVTKVTNTR